eukprot:m.228699 g.228699  ORF g.228699 m.228699 type:complete len:293 (-) comp33544_c3_seq1:88-966(-)
MHQLVIMTSDIDINSRLDALEQANQTFICDLDDIKHRVSVVACKTSQLERSTPTCASKKHTRTHTNKPQSNNVAPVLVFDECDDIEQQYVKLVYEEIATDFSDQRYSTWPWIQSFLDDLDDHSKVLDLGCGNGRNMRDPRHDFVGADNCNAFVSMCVAHGQVVHMSDMTTIDFAADSAFDAAIVIASFHHLSTRERRLQCLSELWRVLKPRGRILLSVWSHDQHHNKKLSFSFGANNVPWKDPDGSVRGNRYYYIFATNELEELAKTSDFEVKTREWDHGNDILILTKKQSQ